MQGTAQIIGAYALSAIPRDVVAVARSDAAQSAQVARLRRRDRTSHSLRQREPVTPEVVEALRAAVAEHGTIAAAAYHLGWTESRASKIAWRNGIKGDPALTLAARRAGPTTRVVIPSAILTRSGAWLAVFRRHGGNRNLYHATRAADAAMVAALEAVL